MFVGPNRVNYATEIGKIRAELSYHNYYKTLKFASVWPKTFITSM
jgi:hypothetical protein